VADLREAYVFLRRIEHWIQLDQNRQTQKLPKSAEARKRLALAMGFDGDFGALEAALQRICSLVQGHFSSLFSARSDPGDGDGELDNQAGRSDLEAIWEQPAFSNLKGVLKPFPRSVRSLLAGVLAGLRREGRRSPVDVVGNRLELYFNRVSHRAGLMRLFDAPGPWMEKLCCGISQSGMLASLLAHQPNLVEGIASIRDVQLNAADWEQFGEQLLAHHQDFEEAIEWVRRLKNERMLMIALADLAGESTQPEVERHLTHLALFVIRKTYERVAGKLQAPPDLPLSILGLGKLGSGELNYLSDLDLMYVYDPQPDEPPDRIPSQVVRLIQRLNHMLSMPLQEGPGYVVDTRLRPTGNYGPLVTTRSAWEDYYAKDADLWEIQALLRMQPVAGNRELSERLAERAGEICHSPRNPAEVWPRLCHLRRRMEGERSGDQEGWIDLKLGYGGVVDMEFLVQGQQLLASPHESLVTIRSVREALPHALARVDVGTVGASETVALFNAFRTLEHRLHLHLNLSTSKLKEEQFEALLDFGLWPIENDRVTIAGWEELKAARRRIRAVWEKICSQWPDA
jgi:glutamate-ammonia-ligase adenylyltransferase